MRPRIVLLDEPDSGIDVEALEKIFEAIHMLKSYGATVILITHSIAVLKQAEHAFLMCRGEIFDKGSVDKISGYFENKCIPCERTAISSSPKETDMKAGQVTPKELYDTTELEYEALVIPMSRTSRCITIRSSARTSSPVSTSPRMKRKTA